MNIETDREFLKALPMALLDPPSLDARIARDPEKLEELAHDIARRGVIMPLHVFRVGDRFEVVDGERRHQACQLIRRETAPAFVYATKDLALEGVKYAANEFREDMSPAEQAIYFNELMLHECGNDIEKVCALVGKKCSFVSSRLELLNGYEIVFEAVRTRQITLGVAAELNKITDPTYVRYYTEHAIRGGATITVVAGWVSEWRQMFAGAPQAPAPTESATPDAPGIAHDPNACLICGRADKAHLIRWRPIHTHCELAILEPLLKGAADSAS